MRTLPYFIEKNEESDLLSILENTNIEETIPMELEGGLL